MGLRKLGEWMGLVEDGRYSDPKVELSEEYSFDEPVEPEPVARSPRSRTVAASHTAAPVVPDQPIVEEPKQMADLGRIVSVRPRSYNEARSIGESFRDGIPVIMNLSDMERGEDKRLVDFAAGLIFGLRGNIERISSQVFLLCPHNLVVGPEDKARLATGGFFNQS